MTWADLAVAVGFVVAALAFWGALVAIATWQEWRDGEGDK